MNYIIGRWLDKDCEEAAKEFQITRAEYRRMLAGLASTNAGKD